MKKYNPTPEEFAAIYARKSTKLENNSLHSQASLARDEIKKRNLFLYDIYEDEESATKFHPMHRPGFKRLLYDAMEGKFKTVVVFRRDRLARRVEDLIEIKNFFKKYGIKIIYSNQGEFQPDDSSYISSFIENIIISVDELEPGILSERIAAGKEQKRNRGEYSGRPPFGYVKINNGNQKIEFVADSINGPIVNNIFEKFVNEVTNLDQFNRYIKTIKDSYRSLSLNESKIKDILLRPLYGGLMIKIPKTDPLKTVITNCNSQYEVDRDLYVHCITVKEPIVNTNTWYECLTKYKKIIPEEIIIENEESSYLFKNLLYCKKCGKPIYLSNGVYKCLKECTNIDSSALTDLLIIKIIKDLINKDNIQEYQRARIARIKRLISTIEDDIEKKRKLQEKEIQNLIHNYVPNQSTNYDFINMLIDEENKLLLSIQKKKQTSVETKLALEQLLKVYEINNQVVLVNLFKRNSELSQELFTNIIKKIYINLEQVSKRNGRGFDIKYIDEFSSSLH